MRLKWDIVLDTVQIFNTNFPKNYYKDCTSYMIEDNSIVDSARKFWVKITKSLGKRVNEFFLEIRTSVIPTKFAMCLLFSVLGTVLDTHIFCRHI